MEESYERLEARKDEEPCEESVCDTSKALTRRDLDDKLSQYNLTLSGQEGYQQKQRNLVSEIRASREIERGGFGYEKRDFPAGISHVEGKIREVAALNRKIEKAVKREVLGIQNKPLYKLWYDVKDYLAGKVEPAESVINKQIANVDLVVRGVMNCSNRIDGRLNKVEDRYRAVFSQLIGKNQENQDILVEIDEKRRIMPLLAEAIRECEERGDLGKKMEYIWALREARKSIESSAHRLKLNDKRLGLLTNELPILDDLGSIGNAYSYYLKELFQESSLMKEHLESVMGAYLDMLRSQKVNLSLEKEVRKLFEYTHNMQSAVSVATSELIERANGSSAIEIEFSNNAGNLGNALERIESATFRGLGDLESRLNSYQRIERGP